MPEDAAGYDNRNKKWHGEASHRMLHPHLGIQRTASTQIPKWDGSYHDAIQNYVGEYASNE